MFTGLIAELGKITALKKDGRSYTLSITAKKVMEGLRIGDSVAVNGACLTVVAMDSAGFSVEATPETSEHTIIPILKTGDLVNLERTLRVGDRLDGHMVSGHVECTGKIIAAKRDEIAVIITVAVPKEAMRYIILKGSVTVDGISLTVCALGENNFSVSLIPHTAQNTTLGYKKVGDMVNIETDIIGKYVEKLLQTKDSQEKSGGLTMAALLENGFGRN